MLPDLLEEDICLALKELSEFELVQLYHADDLRPSLQELLDILGLLELREICLEHEDANLTNLVKILFVKVWQLLLTED